MKNGSFHRARVFGAGIVSSFVLISGVAQALAQSATFTTQAYPLIGNTHVDADFNGDASPTSPAVA